MLTVTGEKLGTEALSNERIKVGIFGPYGFGNMGDAMLADASIAGIRRHLPNAEFVGICQQPDNARKRHGIDALSMHRDYIRPPETIDSCPQNTPPQQSHSPHNNPPNNRQPSTGQHVNRNDTSLYKKVADLLKTIPPLFKFLKWIRNIMQGCVIFVQEVRFSFAIYRHLKNFDLLVISGSGIFNEEWGGPWSFPFALFRWSLLARFTKCKVAYMSVGGGAFKSRLTKVLCKWAVNLSHYRSVRDHNTLRHLSAWGAKDLQVVPDMAFSAELPPAKASQAAAPPMVCINPISYCDPRSWHVSDPVRYQAYTGKLAEFGKLLLDRGFALHFVPNNIEMDNPTIDDIIEKLAPDAGSAHLITRSRATTYQHVYHGIGQCDFVIASRFHGVVFSLMQAKPVIAVAHHYKYREVLKDMEQEAYCLDIASFQVAELYRLFTALEAEQPHITHKSKRYAAAFKAKTEEQFYAVASLVTPLRHK